MVHVLGFDSHDAMLDHLRQQAEAALASLLPPQQALTWGSHWVQFVDVAHRHVVFGRVFTVQDVRAGEIEAGATKREAESVVDQTVISLRDGMMYGRASDLFNPTGELGYTHKAVAWPIDEFLFAEARSVDWQIDQLSMGQKVSLEMAFRASRGLR